MDVFVVGAGGFAGEVIEAFLSRGDPELDLRGVFDDDTRFERTKPHGLEYLGTIEEFAQSRAKLSFVLAIGDNAARQHVSQQLLCSDKQPLPVVHRLANVSPTAHLGSGAYIGAFAFVGPRCRIDRFALVNVSSSVGHDAVIEEFAQLCPGARVSGYCRVGKAAFLGSNSGLAPSVIVGSHAKLAGGSFAFRNIPDGRLAVGNPAKLAL